MTEDQHKGLRGNGKINCSKNLTAQCRNWVQNFFVGICRCFWVWWQVFKFRTGCFAHIGHF